MTSVVVVGGGLAGITAALTAADAGATVTLLESRPRLGGATSSFRRNGLWIDNGQHVFLRCCTRYLALLERIGSRGGVTMQNRLDIPVVLASGGRARLRRSALALPSPLHLAGALASYQALSVVDRMRAVTAVARLGRLDPTDPAVDAQTFGDWLAKHGQSGRSIEALWSLVTVATLNTAVSEASLSLAAQVFQTGLLARADAGDVGMPALPLQELHGDASARALAAAGVDVRLGARVRRVAGDLTVHLDEEVLYADAVIAAVPHDVAATLLPERVVARAAELGSAPILNVHVIYDRPVTSESFVAVLGELQWVFDRTAISGARGQHLAASISAANELAGLPVKELRTRLLPQFTAAFPAAGSAGVSDFFVTREPAATFRQRAGTAVLRPGATTAVPGLFLAGAWTATGWPATMEGAVRSGESAAAAALGAFPLAGAGRSTTEGAVA